jgi:hypothetical protein
LPEVCVRQPSILTDRWQRSNHQSGLCWVSGTATDLPVSHRYEFSWVPNAASSEPNESSSGQLKNIEIQQEFMKYT